MSSANRKFKGYLVSYSLRNLTSLTFAFAHLVLFLVFGFGGVEGGDGFSIHSSSCPGAHSIKQASLKLELRNPPTCTPHSADL